MAPHADGYIYNNRSSANPRPSPRPIEDFRSPLEFLMAMYDAVESHGSQYVQTGEVHGNINSQTVWIGSPAVCSNRMGFLMESSIKQRTFQSVNLLSETVLMQIRTAPLDYLDDLESFYYIMAWVIMGYSATGQQLYPFEYPPELAVWAAQPDFQSSVREKEKRLRGSGFLSHKFKWCCLGGKEYADLFSDLLTSIHSLLKPLYTAKLKGNVDYLELKNVFAIYIDYLNILEKAIRSVNEVSRKQCSGGPVGELLQK